MTAQANNDSHVGALGDAGADLPTTEYNTLNDSLAGRLAQAGVGAAITALPDYVSSRTLRALIDVILGSSLGAALIYSNAQDDDPNNDPAAVFEDISAIDLGGPVKTWAAVIAGLGAVVASCYWSSKSQEKMAAWMYKRGVKKPNTILGVLAGMLIFFGSQQQ